ncbi:two-component sensor histidine kinase [Parafrankia colletiae]|uniref:Signal transduction histidine-protein kinase/phosphatase MprB n=1 Tax=Parafrankia colletiae TaxID=573497 RepID=A0A1S1QFV3_9ACTN|nr:HAMP domain-containing sensor histidine kinase [Parafrankia colletiae]MCK9900384.1 HAMP domain-containing histidine kinase [Frankia sp. Cpl3]OHV33688.1 two-component sensor histidine kinase [Parafrankia colletiae]
MRWALARVSIAVTTMVALAFLVPLVLTVQRTAHDRAFTDGERRAAELGPALAVTTDQAALRRALASTRGGAEGRVAVHVPAPGSTAARTRAAPLVTVGRSRVGDSELASVARAGSSAVVAVPRGSVLLRPVAVTGARIAVIEVFIPDTELDRGVARACLVLGGVAAALVLASVLVADRLGTRIVRSARGLARAARELGAGDLTARAHVADQAAPAELHEAAVAFNTMADRVRMLLAAERERAADLSHRLRTPLTVLRLNTAALGGGSFDGDGEADGWVDGSADGRVGGGLAGSGHGGDAAAAAAATAVRHAVAQLEHEVDYIIRAARALGDEQVVAPRCDAADVLRDRADFWSVLAEDQGRSWSVSGVGRPAPVPVAPAELATALDALLGNVFRHTAEGVAFAVHLRRTDQAVTVRVLDAGPGVADPAAALRRGGGAGGAGSTGLGLDIARRLAESTGGELTVGRSPLGGAELRLRLRTETSAAGAPAGRRRTRHRRGSRTRAR